jgi:uncharacterized protein (DUF924 family)
MIRATSDPQSIISFWRTAGPDRWFNSDPAFDAEVGRRFQATLEVAAINDLTSWEGTAKGALALALVLGQFPRHIFRGAARAFGTDPLAREVTNRAIKRGFDRDTEPPLRNFLYLPFMRSEEIADQERSLAFFQAEGDQELIKLAELHLETIRTFGRFPQRNKILGRTSTPEEEAFLSGNHHQALC